MNIQKIEKPWGYELLWAKTPKYVGKILHIESGHALSKQYHQIKDETIYVQSGILTLELKDNQHSFNFDDIESDYVDEYSLILEPGENFHIPPGLIHRMIAENGPVEVFEVSTPELLDVIRIDDKYGRK